MFKSILAALLTAAACFSSGPANAASQLVANGALEKGQSLTSNNGLYTLIQQQDGNLVLYRGTTPLWATYKNGQQTIMQHDGNLVQYNLAGAPVWDAGTGGHAIAPGNYGVTVKDDGSLVVGTIPAVLATQWSKVIVGPDSQAPTPPPPTGPCGNGRPPQIYQVCIPTGVGRGMNGTITACSQSDAATIASRNGWAFGSCTF